MDKAVVEKIKNNPKYIELTSKRSSFAWKLSFLMLIVYYTFILVIAFDPTLLGTKLSSEGVITLGIPVGVFIIIFAFVITGIYVRRANSEFDDMTAELKRTLEKENTGGAA